MRTSRVREDGRARTRPTRRARSLGVALVLAGLLAALVPAPAAAWPSPPPGPYAPHGSISITSDAGFTFANGVRSGTGTPADPYVISGWHVTSSGIAVKGVTKSFVIVNNFVEVSGSGWAVTIENVQVPSAVVNNALKFVRGGGVQVKDADTTVQDNQLLGGSWDSNGGTGVQLTSSNSEVRGNVLAETAFGVKAKYGSPRIIGNNMGESDKGVLLDNAGMGTNVSGNIIANIHQYGVYLLYGSNVSIQSNLIEQVKIGVKLQSCVAAVVRGNVIHDHSEVGILYESCNGTSEANLVADGKAGIQVWQSDAIIRNNTVYNHLAIGIEWMMSEGIMADNRFELNGLGVRLQDMGVVRMWRNTFVNNTMGVDIPYPARQSIPHMRGNVVNGLNIDGTIRPAEKAYYYKAANVLVNGALFDSGFGARYYGATTAQGGLTFYEVNSALVANSEISNNRVGVMIVNSFNVTVRDSLIVNNVIGINITTADPMGQVVPPCVGAAKNVTIIIRVDPPLTYGVRNKGCIFLLYDSVITGMDVGVYFDSAAAGEIMRNRISRTTTAGIWLEGASNQPNDVVLAYDNELWSNRLAVWLKGSGAKFQANSIHDNSREGFRLEAGAHPVLVRNNVTRNADGLFDAETCRTSGSSCSRLPRSEGNVFFANARYGALVNGGATVNGDLYLANGAQGFEYRSDATLRNVRSQGNGGDGGVLVGTNVVTGSRFLDNGANGLALVGTTTLSDSRFERNGAAGVKSSGNWLSGNRLVVANNQDGVVVNEGSPSLGTPAVPYPYVQPSTLLYGKDGQGGLGALAGSSVFLHRSQVVGNERNAFRAGASYVNATYNYWGDVNGPTIDTGVTGRFGNSVSPTVLFVPYYRDGALTTTGPLAGL